MLEDSIEIANDVIVALTAPVGVIVTSNSDALKYQAIRYRSDDFDRSIREILLSSIDDVTFLIGAYISNVESQIEKGNFIDLIDTVNIGGSLNWKMVCGVIQNTGSGWAQIGGNHQPLNTDSVSNDNVQITIDFTSLGVIAVGTFIVGSDDAYAGLYHAGAGVGLTVANISIYKGVVSGSDVIRSLVDPSTLISASGNFWYIGMMQLT